MYSILTDPFNSIPHKMYLIQLIKDANDTEQQNCSQLSQFTVKISTRMKYSNSKRLDAKLSSTFQYSCNILFFCEIGKKFDPLEFQSIVWNEKMKFEAFHVLLQFYFFTFCFFQKLQFFFVRNKNVQNRKFLFFVESFFQKVPELIYFFNPT